jgi:hypothetical protein
MPLKGRRAPRRHPGQLIAFVTAPRPLVLAGIGPALRSAPLLPRAFAQAALPLAWLFLLSGIAVLDNPGWIFVPVMSVPQAVWIVTATVGFALTNSPRRGYR